MTEERAAQPLPAGEVVCEGEVLRVTFENPGTSFRVLQLSIPNQKNKLTVIGTFPEARAGARLRVRGKMISDAKYGEQLRAESVTELAPNTLKGIERYLGSGIISGVGPQTAKRIVEHFGLETLTVLDANADKLFEVSGMGKKKAQAIARGWKEQRALRDTMIFLQSHGATGALAMRIFRKYGTESPSIVARDPYRLALEVPGVGFRTADRMAEGMGVLPDAPSRLQAGVMQVLTDASEQGHTSLPAAELVERALQLLPRENYMPEEAEIQRAKQGLMLGGHIMLDDDPARGELITMTNLHAAELRLSARLTELTRTQGKKLTGTEEAIRDFERTQKVSLAEEQVRAISAAADHAALVVTGGPGVGKTTIVRAILSLFRQMKLTVRLAAPTGRAAKRLSESTGMEATTLHRLLEFEPKSGRFLRNQDNPVEADVVIVDEASMIDLLLADALTQALATGTRIVLVGDVDQLPSVGPGAVLRDLISSQTVACVRLTQIFRQAEESLIVRNAHLINQGLTPERREGNDTDFFIIDRRVPEEALATLLEVVCERIPKRFGFNPTTDVQVLTPMHKGPVGSAALNEALQARLNPHGKGISVGHKTLRVGDKVMQLRNDYDRDVWNGDLGIVDSVDEATGTVIARFDERKVTYEGIAADDLTLAYACTIHKSQGSEYPVVVIPLLTSHFVMLSRNLLYTAVTRGKKLVVLVADPKALSLALMEARRGERITQLERRLASPPLTS